MKRSGAVMLALAMTFTMMLPVNLAAYAEDQGATEFQEAQETEDQGAFNPLDASPETYAITINPVTNGSVTADVEAAAQGSSVVLAVVADEGYRLNPGTLKVITDVQKAPRLIRGEGTAENPYYFVMPADSVTISAEFVKIRSITIADGIEHGTVTTDVSTGVQSDKVTITVTPEEGYRLKFNSTTNQPNKTLKATYNGTTNVAIADYFYDPTTNIQTDLNIAATTYSFTMPAGDVTITAEFTAALSIKVDENITNGKVNLNGRTVAGVGERVPVSSAPDGGYLLTPNSLKVIAADNSEIAYNSTYAEFIMPADDVTITAAFEKAPALEGINFVVTPGDTEAIATFSVTRLYASYNISYREKGSDNAYTSRSFYVGGYAVGAPYTATITGLTNDTEYEFFIQDTGTGGVSEIVSAKPEAVLPSGVILNRSSATIVLGETVALYATVVPAETKATGITWTSSNEDVATVGVHGVIETQALGYAEITVTTDVGGKTAVCDVYVVKDTTTPSGGSMIAGTVAATYDESGGTAEVPFTVIVPTNRPIFEFDFTFAPGTATTANYSITGIKLGGTSLVGSATTEVDDVKVRISTALPLMANYNSGALAIVTPIEGRFLEPGKTYQFTLQIAIKSTAPPVIPINFGNSMNYSYTFYYYDYDYSPNRDRFAGAAVTQGGIINATWTGASAEPPHGGTGAALTYYLSTPTDLLWYANQISLGNQVRGTLYADIDLTGTAFDGIGTETNPLAAMFNGNGKTVTYNLTQSAGGAGAVGFVRYMSNGSVSNLTTKGTINVTAGTVNVGGIVGEIVGTGYATNNKNEVDITVTGTAGGSVGGIAGYANSGTTQFAGVVGNNTNLGTITADGTGVIAVGGIAGYVKNGKISGTGNGGTTRETSGVSGRGNVTGRGAVGGIVGISENTQIKELTDNTNFAVITGLSGEATGGIAGKVTMAHIGGTYNGADRTQYPNRNYGAVTGATDSVGGIVAFLDNSTTERTALNYNEGSVTGTSASGAVVGGIIGRTTGSDTVTIADNTNKGVITAGEGAVKGGVLGKADAELSQELCVGNYYVETDGLGDAVFSQTALASWLSLDGWSPQYSGTGGDGSVEDPYQIANIFDFLWFTKQVNSGTEPEISPGMNYNVILVTDLDLTDYPAYEGIGTTGYPGHSYHGIFDGNGHTITIALDGFSTGGKALGSNMAIFRRCSGATIKNLTVEGSVVGNSVAGVALQFDGGTLENVHNYADVTNPSGNGSAGGIIGGSSPSKMKNVTNHGTIIGNNAAGLAVTIVSSTELDDCVNYGDVTGRMIAAGLVANVGAGAKSTDGNPSLIIKNSRNEGTVTSLAPAVLDNVAWYNNGDPSTNHTAGGIIGKVDNAIIEINNVTNNGTVQGTGNNIGGILGTSTFGDYQDTDFRIINSTNNGTVRSTYDGDDPWYLSHINVGGIVGNTSGNFDPSTQWDPYGTPGHTQKAQLIGNTNNGTVYGPEGVNIGGIAGLISGNEETVIIKDNFSTIAVIDAGRKPVAGTYYDPITHEVVNGQVVPKQIPTNPPDPGNPNSPSTPNAPTGNQNTNTQTPSTSGSTADSTPATTAPTTTSTPRTETKPETTTTDTPAGTISDPPTPLVGSEVVPTKQAQTFIEYVIDNPLLIPVGILALALIVGGAAFAYVRFKRNTATDDAGRGRHGS
jgi:hypothetical protein